MRAIVQRVLRASVTVDGRVISKIGPGLVVFIAVGCNDTDDDIGYIVDKTVNMRIFERNGKFDLSLKDISGEVLLISQFTLYGDVRKGRRPSFTEACPPDKARSIYDKVCKNFEHAVPTKKGEFQAHMSVELINDGPVTILLDSRKSF